MKSKDLYWLAGLIEGEGCFAKSGRTPSIRIDMLDKDVVDRAAHLMGPCTVHSRTIPTGHLQYRTIVCGERAIALMVRLLPLMGKRRQIKIRDVLDWAAARPGHVIGERHWNWKGGISKGYKRRMTNAMETRK